MRLFPRRLVLDEKGSWYWRVLMGQLTDFRTHQLVPLGLLPLTQAPQHMGTTGAKVSPLHVASELGRGRVGA